ncbi:MAG: type I restriction endonuclease subunit R [Campylobacterales bacterium]|nr:type I restriction endonuclease subunit R [Campylobacterales bacterium]
MSTQSEAILEENLLKQLELQEYERVVINDDSELEKNLKSQLEKHNKTTITDTEFKRVLNHLKKGSIFEKAKILRDKFVLPCDDGTTKYIEFLDSEHWCQNLFQVTSQVTVEGKYKNRYDVTILINGFPLVQIELKRRGLELKEAFNQTLRYKRHSYSANNALFNYIQLFVISNGVNTKYYANSKLESMSFKQTFYWTDKENKRVDNLEKFTEVFLERCHLSKMVCKYIVLAEVPKILMVLRPYQFHAVESIIDRVSNSNKNGYIWHTTGSGKTLTSFKTAQIVMKLPKVHKVVFVVDRKDLDYQTTKEFNSFSDGSVDGTDNTKALVKQFSDDTKLIVTTIQKLNTAISKKQYLSQMEELKDKHIVFIFDECHRSQFGETHLAITKFFTKNQMIGFTGTPIFVENASSNALGKRTTKELYDDALHKYVITDAINDDNVLKFSIEYVGRYKEKEGSETYKDIDVEAIDTKELLESDKRIEEIVNYIISNHNRKTHSKQFTAMMCVSSVPMLIKYYELFKSKEHNLKIATIFSYSANEEDQDATGEINLDESDGAHVDEEHINKHSREKLDEFIEDYNGMFGCKYSTKDSQSFYNYYNDISKRVKQKEIDILLVVNMFLTGFDSKTLNTLYVDKNLKYHGLIQAFSRTNRILNEQKSQGNVICFRNLKKNTDDAIALFSNKDAKEIILMEPYEDYVKKFNEKYEALKTIAPTVQSVSELFGDDEKLEFVTAFRALMRVKNVIAGFSDFKWSDVEMNEQEFEDYKSKYLDMHEEIGKGKGDGVEKVSILEDVDFELELIHKDEINVTYIIQLLAQYAETEDDAVKSKQKENITNILNNNPQLRSKRELIERFIYENLANIKNSDDIEHEFEKFWDEEKEKAFNELCEEENLQSDKVKQVIDTYLYDERVPLANDIAGTLKVKPKLLERKKIVPRVLDKIVGFVDKFFEK